MLCTFPLDFQNYQAVGCRSIGEGYNEAVWRTNSLDGDILIFVHDDVRYWGSKALLDHAIQLAGTPGIGFIGAAGRASPLTTSGMWWDDLEHLRGAVAHDKLHGGVLKMSGYGPYGECNVLDGLLLMCHRRVFDKIGKWDESLGWHFYDLDITIRARKAGLTNLAAPLPVLHGGMGSLNAEWQASRKIFIAKNKIVDMPVGSVKIVGICRTKNNQAIVEPFVRHHLRLLDRLVICDNGSVDGTKDILKQLAAEDGRLQIIHDKTFGNFQDAHYARLLKIAGSFKPDYVVPLDADEFLGVADRFEFESELRRIPVGGAGVTYWRTFVVTEDTVASCAANSPAGFRWRRRLELPQIGKVIIRVAGRNALDFRFGSGNHSAETSDGIGLATVELAFPLLHFPVISRKQMLAKGVIHWMAYLASDPKVRPIAIANKGDGWHTVRNFDRIVGNGGEITDAQLCEMSLMYAQDLEGEGKRPELMQDEHGIQYERKYSTGESMAALPLIARAWEQSLTGI